MGEFIDSSLTDLALLVRVLESGGFTAAARATGVPQATISRRIAMLEARIGLRLLDRTTRRMALTEAGRRIFDHGRAMLDQAEAAHAALAVMQGEPSGRLSIVAPIILGQAFVADIVADFMATYPKIDVVLEWTTRQANPVEDGIDVVVRVGRPPDSSAMLTRLGHAEVCLYAPPGATGGQPRTPRDLAEYRIVALGRNLDDASLVLQNGDRIETVAVSRALVSNDVLPVIAASRAIGALALLPRFAAPEGWQDCLPEWDLPPLELNAMTAPSRGALPKIRLFLDALKQGVRGRQTVTAGSHA